MATFEDFLAKARQKAAQDIQENPNTPNGLTRPPELNTPEAMQQAAVPTEADLAALPANNALLGLSSPEIPMRREENQALPYDIGMGSLPAPVAPIAEVPTEQPAPAQDVVKAMQSIRTKKVSSGGESPAAVVPAGPAAPKDLSDKEFASAQEDTKYNRMLAGLLASGEEVGRGISGLGAGATLETPKSGVIKGLGETSDNPVKDLAAKRKAEKEMLDLLDDKSKNDPNSEVSKLYRDSFAKMGVKIGANATAADLEKAQPAIGAMMNKQMQIEANKMKREEMALTRQIALGSKTNAAEQKKMDNISKGISTFRGDPAAAKAADALRRASMADRLLDLPKWDSTQRELFAGELSSLVKGGVPTEHELKSILPDTSVSRFAKAMTFVSGEPEDVSDVNYKKKMKHYLGELKEINQEYLDKRKEKIISLGGYKNLSEESKDLIRAEEPEIAARLEGKSIPKKAESTGMKSPTPAQVSQYFNAHKDSIPNFTPEQATAILTKRLNQ
ncbi:MAG: hypothetical protein ACOYOV_00045 [Bacteroidales bacterium]